MAGIQLQGEAQLLIRPFYAANILTDNRYRSAFA